MKNNIDSITRSCVITQLLLSIELIVNNTQGSFVNIFLDQLSTKLDRKMLAQLKASFSCAEIAL